jgi:DNA replicative helicase MCM subunit Mcm2 (Cdc46/Mcm family)
LAEEKAPHLYGNVVQVTRSPWEVNLHILRAIVPRTAKPGDRVNIVDIAEEVAVVTLPLEVGQQLIGVLQTMTAKGVIEPVKEKEATKGRSEKEASDAR